MDRDPVGLLLLLSLEILAAATISGTLVLFLRAWARRRGRLSVPGPVSTHTGSIPKLGGISILFTLGWMLAPGIALLIQRPDLQALPIPASARKGLHWVLSEVAPTFSTYSRLIGLLLGSTVIFCFGLIDDLRALSPRWKILGQALAAIILLASGIRTEFFVSDPLNIVVTFVWILGVTNAFNLLDNTDGLAAGVSLIGGTLLLIVAFVSGQFLMAGFLGIMVGATLGFLIFNFPRASVFLGDAGSQLLGFLFAGLSVLESYVTPESPGLFPVALPLLVLAVPLFDTAAVVTHRLVNRRPIFQGDTHHLSHRLIRMGLSRSQAVIFQWLLTLSCGVTACLLPWLPPWGVGLVLGQAVVTVAMVWLLIGAKDRKKSRE